MNALLDKVATWLAFNKLSLNIAKTKFITFGNYCGSVPLDINVEIQKQKVTRTESYKYLGIYLDYNMNWHKHIDYIINRTKYFIFIFAKIKKFMDTNTLMIIYYALFHSIISYGIIAWGGAYKNRLNVVAKHSNKVTKNYQQKSFL